MKVIEQSFYELNDNRLLQKIELCGRVCYKSEDKITETSALNFVKRICVNNHGSVLEHYTFVFKVSEEYYFLLKSCDLKFFDFTNISYPIVSFNLRAFLNYYNNDNNYEPLLPIITYLSNKYPELFNKPTSSFVNYEISEVEDLFTLKDEERDVHQKVSIKLITDRGVTHQLVRHRLASFSQESTRYCNYAKDKFNNEIVVIRPEGITEEQYDIWAKAMEECEKAYFNMISNGALPQLARGVLPTSLKTEIVITASIQEWKVIFDLRCSSHAQPDTRVLMEKVKEHFITKGYINENY